MNTKKSITFKVLKCILFLLISNLKYKMRKVLRLGESKVFLVIPSLIIQFILIICTILNVITTKIIDEAFKCIRN